MAMANKSLQRTAASRCYSIRHLSWPPSLSLGRSLVRRSQVGSESLASAWRRDFSPRMTRMGADSFRVFCLVCGYRSGRCGTAGSHGESESGIWPEFFEMLSTLPTHHGANAGPRFGFVLGVSVFPRPVSGVAQFWR
jgi:hypothetical protein